MHASILHRTSICCQHSSAMKRAKECDFPSPRRRHFIMTMSMATTKTKSGSSEPFPYEFGGPVGALATTLALPVVVLLLSYWSLVGKVDLDVFGGGDLILAIRAAISSLLSFLSR